MSPVFIGTLIQLLVNPDDELPSITVYEGEKIVNYFDDAVTDRLVYFFVPVGIYHIICGIFGPII